MAQAEYINFTAVMIVKEDLTFTFITNTVTQLAQ
jgi:hypothetical protein